MSMQNNYKHMQSGKLVSSIRSNGELFTWNILLTRYCFLLLRLNLVPFDCSYVTLLTDLVIEWETYHFVLSFICILEGYIFAYKLSETCFSMLPS